MPQWPRPDGDTVHDTEDIMTGYRLFALLATIVAVIAIVNYIVAPAAQSIMDTAATIQTVTG